MKTNLENQTSWDALYSGLVLCVRCTGDGFVATSLHGQEFYAIHPVDATLHAADFEERLEAVQSGKQSTLMKHTQQLGKPCSCARCEAAKAAGGGK